MKNSKERNFERELPEGYTEKLYINAKKAKWGIIFNLVGFAIAVVVMVFAILALGWGDITLSEAFDVNRGQYGLAFIVFVVTTLAYVVLHELVHGLCYKLLTGEKLTFGLSWSCAFCGVPNIYTYRKTAIIAVLAPLVIFTMIFVPILVLLYTASPIYFLFIALEFGLHLGGCSGDLYAFYLLAFRFRGKKLLMRDTGPEQFFYVCDKED